MPHPCQARYRILDTELCLSSDSPQLLELFDRDYAAFRADDLGGRADLDISARFEGPGGPGIRFRRSGAGEDGMRREGGQSLDGQPTPVHFAWQWATQTLFDNLHRYLLLHAAVAVCQGRAVVLAGPPGTGKTTMTLELARRGFTVYSDEICPIHRKTGRVHPFPRSLWVLSDPNPPAAGNRSSGLRENKFPLAVADLAGSAAAGETAALGLLVILDPGPGASTVGRLVLGARDPGWEALIDDVRGLHPEVEVTRPREGVAEFHIDYPLGRGLSGGISAILDTHRNNLLNVFRGETSRPDFSRPPALEPIPAHRAAFGLLPCLKQRPEGDYSRRLQELIEQLADKECYRLTVGRLEEQLALIDRLVPGAVRTENSDLR